MYKSNSFKRMVMFISALLLVNSDVALSFTSLVSKSDFNTRKYGNRGYRSRQQSSLHAVNESNFKIKRSRRADIHPLHASAFLHKEETNTLMSQETLEVDLLKQRIQLEELLEEIPKVDLIGGIEDASIDQKIDSSKRDIVWFSRLLLLLSAALTGTNFTFIKVMNDNIPSLHGTMIRFTLAAIATSPWLLKKVHENNSSQDYFIDQGQDSRTEISFPFLGDLIPFASKHLKIMLAGLEVGCWTAIGYVSQSIGLETIQASTSSFICSLAVVVVPILDCLSGKKISIKTLVGALMAVIGVGLLELDGSSITNVFNEDGKILSDGDIFTLIQPITFGIGFWRMEQAMKRYPKEAMKLTATQLSAIAIFSMISCIALSGDMNGLPSYSDLATWLHDKMILQSLLWTGLINTALTIFMETFALQSLSATETTILLSTEPVFGSIFAGVILNETFGSGGIVGALIISIGCLISNLNFTRNAKHYVDTKDFL